MNVKEWNKEGLKPSYYVAPCPYCNQYPKVYKAHERPLIWAVAHYCEKIAITCEDSRQDVAADYWNNSTKRIKEADERREAERAQVTLAEVIQENNLKDYLNSRGEIWTE